MCHTTHYHVCSRNKAPNLGAKVYLHIRDIWSVLMIYDVLWCVLWCDLFVMFNDVIYDQFMMIYDVLWSVYDDLWCFMMCFMMWYPIWRYFNVFKHTPSPIQGSFVAWLSGMRVKYFLTSNRWSLPDAWAALQIQIKTNKQMMNIII